MMNDRTTRRRQVVFALALFAGSLALAGPAFARHPAPEIDQCAPPIATCRGDVGIDPTCPDGYGCVCVPSCPNCRDCAARVCVPAPEPPPECETACNCPSGLGCFNQQCIAGFAPVYCCEGQFCPTGDQCQHRDGRMDRCGEALCSELSSKARTKLSRVIKHAKRCRRDEQCVRVDTSTRCGGTCGEFVNQRAARFVRRAVKYLDHRHCAEFEKLGCPFATPGCIETTAACVEGRCQGVSPVPRRSP